MQRKTDFMCGHRRLGMVVMVAVTAAVGGATRPQAMHGPADEAGMGTRDGARFAAAQTIAADAGRNRRSARVSLDGRFIAFASDARLDPADTNGVTDIYVLDRTASTITLESVDSDGAVANAECHLPDLSADGRYLVFVSSATNLDRRAHEGPWPNVFLRDRLRGVTRMISVTSAGEAANGPSGEPVISADARTIAYTSWATNLAPGPDANGAAMDVYVLDLATGSHSRASISSDGRQPIGGASFGPSISGDGALIAFTSTANFGATSPGCATPDTRPVSAARVYVRDNRRQTLSCIDGRVSESAGHRRSHSPSLSPDGKFVAFVFQAVSAADQGGHESRIYLHDLERSITTLVSRTRAGASANGDSTRPAVSAGGRFVVFESVASNLECERRCRTKTTDLNLLPDVYLMDVEAGRARRLSTGGSPGEWWAPSVAPTIDGSGRIVAFSSRQPSTRDDVDTAFDLYVWTPEGAGVSQTAARR
jgi:Tol biopolymer transport system component